MRFEERIETLSTAHKETLVGWLDNATLEIFPDSRVYERMINSGIDREISITSFPEKGIGQTIDLAVGLAGNGFDVRPHLAARNIEDLEEIGHKLKNAGITKIMIIGGDNEEQRGKWGSSFDLLGDLSQTGFVPEKIFIAGYPQGHPFIGEQELEKVLLQKQEFADRNGIEMEVITQVCFDTDDFSDWLQRIRKIGITMPVVAGVPGPLKLGSLASFLRTTGIIDAKKILDKLMQSSQGDELMVLRYRPEELVLDLAEKMGKEIEGIHFYTLNAVKTNINLIENLKEKISK